MKYKVYIKVAAVFSAMMILSTLLGGVVCADNNNTYSVEDLYTYFGVQGGSGGEVTETLSTLPSWSVIKKAAEDDKSIENLKGKEKQKATDKREFANKIILGFSKSSDYSKWKERYDKACKYEVETKEIIPMAGADATEDDFAEVSAVMSQFDNAMLKADVQIMSGSNSGEYSLGAFGRVFTNATGVVISFVRGIMFEMGRVGLTIGSFVFICELFYVGVEPLRPFLGIESKPFIRRRRNEETGLNEKIEDHGVVFRFVGQSARKAVEDEFKIESMDNVVKNNILWSFLFRKIKYMVAIVLAIVLINTNVWGWLCIKIIDFGAGLLS